MLKLLFVVLSSTALFSVVAAGSARATTSAPTVGVYTFVSVTTAVSSSDCGDAVGRTQSGNLYIPARAKPAPH
jgi:hypothetical protein